MRDIRSDLRERLETLQTDRRKLEKRDDMLNRLLREEEERFAIRQVSLFESNDRRPEPTTPLGQFIRETMADGQDWPLDRLKDAAQAKGIDFEGKHPGRVLHFALVGMTNKKYVEQRVNGMWRLIKQEGDTTSA